METYLLFHHETMITTITIIRLCAIIVEILCQHEGQKLQIEYHLFNLQSVFFLPASPLPLLKLFYSTNVW